MTIELTFLTRTSDLSHSDFVERWSDGTAHIDPGVLRRVNHLFQPTEGWPYDGMVESWRSGRDASAPAVAPPNTASHLTVLDEQHVIVEHIGRPVGNIVIMLSFYKRRPDFSYEQFVDYWTGTYADKWRQSPWFVPNPHLIRYVQHVTTPTEGWEYDGFSEVWFSSPEAVAAVLSSDHHQRSIPDLPLFLDPDAALSVWEQRRVVSETIGEVDPAVTDALPVQYPPTAS